MAKISPAIEENQINVITISEITFGERSVEKSDILSTKYIDMEEKTTAHSTVHIFSFIYLL